jgi:pimeloyl-ACP methyl ester carboxylesterase
MPFAKSRDGVTLFYDDKGKGPPIVFAHEFSGSHRSFSHQVETLKISARCITYNARGYDPSGAPDQPASYSQETAANDIIDLLDTLDIPKAHLVGVSMGAATALHCALKNTHRVLSLTLCGIGSGSDDSPATVQSNVEAMVTFIEANGMLAFAEKTNQSLSRNRLAVKNPVEFREFVDRFSVMPPHGIVHTLHGVQMRRPTVYSYEDTLRTMQVSTLIIVGSEDQPCRMPSAFLAKVLPKVRLEVANGCGHLVNLECSTFFSDLIAQFIREFSDSSRETQT